MKKGLVICLICLLAFALVTAVGCSKKKEETATQAAKNENAVKSGMKASLIDPVDKKPVDIARTPYYYVYQDVEYYFNSKDNMEAFKKDPGKYITP